MSKYSMQESSMLGIYSNFTSQRQKVINSQAIHSDFSTSRQEFIAICNKINTSKSHRGSSPAVNTLHQTFSLAHTKPNLYLHTQPTHTQCRNEIRAAGHEVGEAEVEDAAEEIDIAMTGTEETTEAATETTAANATTTAEEVRSQPHNIHLSLAGQRLTSMLQEIVERVRDHHVETIHEIHGHDHHRADRDEETIAGTTDN